MVLWGLGRLGWGWARSRRGGRARGGRGGAWQDYAEGGPVILNQDEAGESGKHLLESGDISSGGHVPGEGVEARRTARAAQAAGGSARCPRGSC